MFALVTLGLVYPDTIYQTCRYLNALAFTKQVWLALLRDARFLLDQWPGSSFHQFTTAELIDLAKRMVHGPQTWSPSHPSEPVVARQEVIHAKIGPGLDFWGKNDPKLLSGGQYILCNRQPALDCWKVADGRLIWKHQSQWEFACVLGFAAEIVDDGQAAVIVICQRASSRQCVLYLFLKCRICLRILDSFVEVVRLDFLTEASQLLFCTHARNTDYHHSFARLRICGDIAVLGINNTNQILLMDWRTQSCFILLVPVVHQMPCDMTQSHLIDFCRSCMT
jgi:hypothetical protein